MSTKIEWTDETWNPVTGCTKVSQGCKNCYAERLWPKVAGAEAKRTGLPPRAFTEVRTHQERLDAPLRWAKPRRIFVNSMSDLFHEDVPEYFMDHVIQVIDMCPQHTFQILTKRPVRMLVYFSNRAFYKPLTNIWLGVSVEDQATADERIPLLLQAPAAVRFVSYEPALGPVDFLKWNIPGHQVARALSSGKGDPCINWIIAGGESGPNARPADPEWFRSVRDQCAAAGVPYFFKQWGAWLPAGQLGNPDSPPSRTGKPAAHPILTTKGAAGRQLDGRTHDEYPSCRT